MAARLAIILFALVAVVFADPDLSKKNVIWKDGLSPHISMYNVIHKTPKYSLTPRNDWNNKCTGNDACGSDAVESVYELSYADGVWLPLCLCRGHVLDAAGMADRFAYVPPPIRSSVNKISAKATGNGAYTMGNSGVYLGKYGPEVFVHESGHSFDYANGISSMSEWINAITTDSCLPDPYARSSVHEAWAQTGVLWSYLALGGADTSILNNGTFRCWQNCGKFAAQILPYKKDKQFDSEKQVRLSAASAGDQFLTAKSDGGVTLTKNGTSTWQFVEASYGQYWLLCDTKSHMCLDGAGITSRGSPKLSTRNATKWQQWTVEGNNARWLRNRANGLYLQLADCNAKGGNLAFSPRSFDTQCQTFNIVGL